jgi:transcriptional regulator with GAF, ATPase, and Fis domain
MRKDGKMPRTDPGTLLTFTGFHDPYSDGPVEGSRQPGPILSLLGERSLETYLTEIRRKLFERALEISGGNQAAAARLLGVSGAAVSKFVNRERSE